MTYDNHLLASFLKNEQWNGNYSDWIKINRTLKMEEI